MLIFVAPVCLIAAVVVLADDPAATAPPAAAAAEDPYAIPEGATEQQLAQQLRQLLNTPPQEDTPESIKAHLLGVRGFVQALQDPDRQIGDNLLLGSFQVEYQILVTLIDELGDTAFEPEVEAFRARLEEDERPAARHAITFVQINEIDSLTEVERTALIERLAVALQGENGTIDGNALRFAEMAGEAMEFVAPDEAAGVYELFVKYLSASSDPNGPAVAEFFQGRANYINLPGNEMEVSGTTVDGHPFDIADFKGQNKVVLVDFWATWCVPCVGELPNLKAHYEAYHDLGFEVVGISLDDDVESLRQFITDQEIAWPTLVETDPAHQSWENPIARHYGISAIPACILINQEGKVVSLEARGPELGRLLEELLGPPPAPIETAAP
jgi:peroxiredoxin